ncbi:MAG: hypothetical protein ACYS9T_09645, partial [Planctomycetota bacterium]
MFRFGIGFDPASPEAAPRQIGFVFLEVEEVFIFIILCDREACGRFGYMEIGFVLHNLVRGS